MRQPDHEHGDESQAGIEPVPPCPEPQDREQRQDQAGAFLHRDDRLVEGGAKEIAQPHLGGGADAEQPRHAHRHRMAPGQKQDDAERGHGERGAVERRGEHGEAGPEQQQCPDPDHLRAHGREGWATMLKEE